MSVEVREYPDHPLLGRKLAVLDSRSRMFGAVTSVVDSDAEPRTKTWRRFPRAFNQGRTSECVLYSGKGLLNTQPINHGNIWYKRLLLKTTPVYKLAQTLDQWPGEDYDGTSCLAGAKALQQLDWIDSYRWCFGLEDVLRTVSWYGPVQIGISWYNSMFSTDADGFLTVNPSSGLAGGHAVEIHGIDVEHEFVVITNSWGTSWGDRGRCYMRWSDLDTLLADWGEAVTYVADPEK